LFSPLNHREYILKHNFISIKIALILEYTLVILSEKDTDNTIKYHVYEPNIAISTFI